MGHLVSESPLQIQLEGCAGSGVISSGLVGRHNAENLVCAFLLLRDLGHDPEAACHALSQASVAPGRLEPVCSESPWQLFVDYAHTPEALSRVLKSLRAAYPHQRLGVGFGAGGDRDATKRPAMGAAAAAGADWCIVTSDNPRTEDPEAIVQQVAAGARAYAVCEVFCEVDRRAAIHQAVDRLSPGEVLVVAGKGHEDYQEINGVRSPFLDHDVLREAVRCTV